jgi:hypothetical protein
MINLIHGKPLIFFAAAVMISVTSVSFSQARIASNEMPLKLVITVLDSQTCYKACLRLEATLSNQSNEPIGIDKVGIRYQIEFRRETTTRTGGSTRFLTSRGDYGPSPPETSNYQLLVPGEAYRTLIELPLDEEFFKGKANYTVKVTYGQFQDETFRAVKLFSGTVESNELKLNLVTCPRKNSVRCKR